MRSDIYTKAVLTVIAIMLTVIACNQYISPAATAQAQGPLAGIQFTFFSSGMNLTALDTRTGEWWDYKQELISGGLDATSEASYTSRLVRHGKLTKLGATTMPYTWLGPGKN